MNKCLFVLLLFIASLQLQAQLVNPEKLNQDISALNDAYKYEASIIKLEEILHNKKSTNYDRYTAYIQKALTFKRLYNYPEVLENLTLATEEAKDTDFEEEADVRVLTEQMFVKFDSRQFDEAEKLIKKIALKNINLLDSETLAFYFGAVAVSKMQDKKYEEAEATLQRAIKILKAESPKHLPVIFNKIIGIAEIYKDREMAQKAFDEGYYYADKHKMDIYKISLYYGMSHFFVVMEDYKNAYQYENKGIDVSSRYNAAFQNGKLSVLEKNLLQKRKNIELDYQRKLKYLLGFLSLVLLAFLIVIIKFYKSNQIKNKLITRENNRMRVELEQLSKELDEKGEQKIQFENYNLSPRQIDIIKLVKQSKTNKEIGYQLHISENTVKYHLKVIYNILEIENRWDLR